MGSHDFQRGGGAAKITSGGIPTVPVVQMDGRANPNLNR